MVNPTLLKEFTLDISIEDFLNLFWVDSSFTYDFLTERLNDIDVTISEWEALSSDTPNINGKRRQIISFHPSKISFPGLPSHAESIKFQSLYTTNLNLESQRFNTDNSYDDNQRIVIKETNNFKGIPYADFFSVNIEWIVLNSHGSLGTSQSGCNISVYVDVSFHKSTWLQGTIESNTKAELASVYNLWVTAAVKLIEENNLNHVFDHAACSIVETESLYVENNNDASAEVEIFSTAESSQLLMQRHSTVRKITRNASSTGRETSIRVEENNDDLKDESLSDDEDDLDFYDCEEGSSSSSSSSVDQSKSFVSHTFRESAAFELMSHNHMMSDTQLSSSQHIHQESATGPMTVHDIAVTVVETTFVFIEFTFWKVN